ncbi:hypothetical protein [Bacillus cereus group sp. TH152-1LC]|uniref:hypothetical protein n=1 Tax=Bacillus cereus group sp. TH152-1LC TaxID=3018060 RepID=UPI0022E5EDDE|nr:hypothetical protein [Bacillus cereus group sp. TH152-1LC]MDA1675372.1 hypothetical protein [Bacillus cereus group sp. TH152-1LC]
MNLDTFKEWAIDNFGQNYGYNAETSTEIQIPKETIQDIYKGLYQKYAINDLYIVSGHCTTCEENNPNTPYHLDTFKVWRQDDKLQKEVQEVLAGIVPNDNARLLREAYSFSNLVVRAAEGLEEAKHVLVEKDFFNHILELNEKAIDDVMQKYTDTVVPVDSVNSGYHYCLRFV